jgi:hypothetical protein
MNKGVDPANMVKQQKAQRSQARPRRFVSFEESGQVMQNRFGLPGGSRGKQNQTSMLV